MLSSKVGLAGQSGLPRGSVTYPMLILAQMSHTTNVYKFWRETPLRKSHFKRLRTIWENIVNMDLMVIGCNRL